jgi:methylenetetrahydrofolate dehydrogenase (NADP+)/methenyltetrahydrofolate cyclohydrolase
MKLIDGNKIAQSIIESLTKEVSKINGPKPTVAFIRVGDDPASVSYVRKKQKTAENIGIQSLLKILPDSISQEELIEEIEVFNDDSNVHGILIQAPLPDHISETTIFNTVKPEKDVDGFHTLNIGKLCQEDPSGFVACTPAGIVELIKHSEIQTEGKHVVVLGRSQIVGKPAALLMIQKGLPGNATVTICHSKTQNLEVITKQADLIIAAIGRPNFVSEAMVKEGVSIIDVGINRIPDSSKKSGFRLVGDVDFEAVSKKCDHITPVPGGVGPMTVAMLMQNTLNAYKNQR